jgi:putative DNA primase/helicase
VFIETLLKLFGDYGEPAKSELLMTHRMDRDAESAQPFMLKLRGKRYITASEVGEGMVLDAALVKTLTGGDEMTCRGLHAAPVKFTVEGKFVIRCNNRPVIDGADQAIWDRVVEIPFDLRLDEADQDTTLRDTLAAELPGILNWAIVGCRRYQRNAMLSAKKMLPNRVRRQTKRYRESQDTIATWLNECTTADSKAKTASLDLFSAYQRWCNECSRPPIAIVRPESQLNFNKALTTKSYTKQKTKHNAIWHGVKLHEEDQS